MSPKVNMTEKMLKSSTVIKDKKSKDPFKYPLKKIIDIVPGLIVCIILSIIGRKLGAFVPTIGGATLTIFLGMAFGNTVGSLDRYKTVLSKGAKFSESNLLSYSIVLLGGTLSIQTLMALGFSGVTFIVIQMTITIIAALFIGKKLGFAENFSMLMASGNAVCGSSAIGATSPAIGASESEKGIAITVVNITGTVLMILLPLIAGVLYTMDTLKTSALIGGVLQSLGQVVASGSMVGTEVRDLATLFKIVRIIFLVIVVLVLGRMKNNSSNREGNNKKTNGTMKSAKVPWYVIGFFVMCSIYSIGLFDSTASSTFKLISSNFEVVALAGIGMRVNFKDLIKQGRKVSIYALSIASIQVISAVILISVLI